MRYCEHDADLDDRTAPELQLLLMELRGKVRELMRAPLEEARHTLLHELFSLLPEGDCGVCPTCLGRSTSVHQARP